MINCIGDRTRTHGMYKTVEYKAWLKMRERCKTTKWPIIKTYMLRGITVCQRWEKFENFFADMGPRPHGTSLDRIDNERGYEPGNCRWADRKTQGSNRSNVKRFVYQGKEMTMPEIAALTGEDYFRIRYLLKIKKLPVEEALAKARFRGRLPSVN